MVAVRTQSVPSLEKALMILELVADSQRGLSLSGLVRKTGLPKSSIHCLLVTLRRRGYLQCNEQSHRYRFGFRLFRLANKAISSSDLHEQAARFLGGLAKKTNLTAHMAILENREAVLVSKVECSGMVRLATWVGKRMDLHCTGVGKALLAHLPEDDVGHIMQERLTRHNDNTICSHNRLKGELVRILQQGYAIDDEEDEVGLRCIAAPVFGPGCGVIASISIAGTTSQITEENFPTLAGEVKMAAAAMSHAFGYDSTAPIAKPWCSARGLSS